jgi:hypothetical protein
MRRLALAAALLLLPLAAAAHLKVGPGSVGIPTGGGAPGTSVVLCQSAVQVPLITITTEAILGTCTIPAGVMGANGSVSVNAVFSNNNSGNNKTFRVRFGGIGGTLYAQTAQSTNISTKLINVIISNRNATNSQVGFATAAAFGSTAAVVTGAIDTTAAVDIVLTGQLANSADNAALESYVVTMARGN